MTPFDPLARLRERYHAHLTSPASRPVRTDEGADGRKEGTVAGKGTRKGMRRGAEWGNETKTIWDQFTADWVSNPELIRVWSDLHLGHENIIGYENRPFGGAFHMNSKLLEAALANVSADQWLLFVGDLAMWKGRSEVATWMADCPGRKILVLGNHDVRGREHPETLADWRTVGFEAVSDVAWLPAAHGAPEVWISHYPLPREMMKDIAINLHGHTHSKIMQGRYANACVENIGYAPISILDLLRRNQL